MQGYGLVLLVLSTLQSFSDLNLGPRAADIHGAFMTAITVRAHVLSIASE